MVPRKRALVAVASGKQPERAAVAVDVAIDGAGDMHLVVTSETDGASTIDYLRLGG
jgi:hypothetical protein